MALPWLIKTRIVPTTIETFIAVRTTWPETARLKKFGFESDISTMGNPGDLSGAV